MEQISCDVLIVGAGPAGLGAAIAASKNTNVKIVCIDKKDKLGIPVSCAEGIGHYLLESVQIKLPKTILDWKIDGIRFYADDFCIDKVGDLWKGYTINKPRLQQWLADIAEKKGVKIFLSTELLDININENLIAESCVVDKAGVKLRICPKVVIACDGVDSKVLDFVKPGRKEEILAKVLSWEITGMKLAVPNLEQIFFGEFAPCGYAYIFPKSKSIANVGVGTYLPKKKLETYFDEFLSLKTVKCQVGRPKFISEKSGTAVIHREPIFEFGNILFAGDAANRNIKPFIEGILPAVISGYVAGETAIDFVIKSGDYHTKMVSNMKNFYDVSDTTTEIMLDIFKLDSKKRALLFMALSAGIFDFPDIRTFYNKDCSEIKRIIAENV
ncbi:MAG: NAD(P)/FAD-dependent oxidoreductase [Candidatus Diapherotrites archaeon]|nr:NAD(P)/FAD-dependent oxidoreductase [Candidatus Diapherotrites archaeon]